MNKIYIGNYNINKAYLGGDLTIKIYLGDNLVYPIEPHDYSQDYLTIESLDDNNTISLVASNTAITKTVSASTDNGETWTEYTSSNGNGTTLATLNNGDKLLVKGENATYAPSSEYYNRFKSAGQFEAYGNIMSLISGDSFANADTLTGTFTFNHLFSNCSGLTSAENLILPATTLTNGCYVTMFAGCSSLTTAPALPATTLAYICYAGMFNSCTSLTNAPALPATTLAEGCYEGMFNNCTSLTVAPELSATTLAQRCYSAMFGMCRSLTTAPALPATTLTYNCYANMFNDCRSLTTAPALPATTLAGYCYDGMFGGCTSLTTAPVLSATTLAYNCYDSMFANCTSLTTAPELPATTLATACYYAMFFGCTGLTTAPDLSASTLVDRCYRDMFSGCTGLNYIKCLATDISAEYCTTNWVDGVASSGTFVKAASMSSWTTGVDGIPTGWVVENEGDLPYDEQYLTIESTSNNNTIYWKSAYSNAFKTISASTDNGNTWTAYTSSSGQTGTTIATLNSGDTIIFKGENAQYNQQGKFKSTSSFITYGNIMSLVYGDNFSGQTALTSGGTFSSLFSECSGLASAENLILPATTLADYCYVAMFRDCTSLTTAPELPATTLAERCYSDMFDGCTSLTSAPALPATTLAEGCYNGMFNGCTNLTTAPELPATTLATGCYEYMFLNCTSLTTAPELPATTLTYNCYANMFNGCTSLNSITCLATDISATDCTGSWVDGVASGGGYLYVPSGNPASWQCGVDGVPSDWTIEDSNGDTYECTGGGGEPSTDVPLENAFAVKVNGVWHKFYNRVSDISHIEMALSDLGLDPSDVEELAIGNRTRDINLDGGSFYNCTGLTLAQNIQSTTDIHNFPAMQWVNVMTRDLFYDGRSGLFSDMNCCPIYVPEDYLSDYQSNWENETTEDCDGSVADRLVAWTPYIDPNA